MHPHLKLDEQPTLKNPVLVLAWGGWSDAGNAATHAARAVISALKATRFGSIDPEEYYDFTVARPFARYRDGEREIVWPSTDFFHCADAGLERDLVIGVGSEPNNRWRSYMAAMLDFARTVDVDLVVTLAAVAAPVPHTQPVRVWGSANDPALADRYDMHPPAYEGPTGMVGAFHDHCRKHGLAAISLWAGVPHYLERMSNPAAALAILERLQGVIETPLPLAPVRAEIARFEAEVRKVLEQSEDLTAYVRRLEEAVEDSEPTQEPPSQELPSAEGLIADLEQFLHGRRPDQPGGSNG